MKTNDSYAPLGTFTFTIGIDWNKEINGESEADDPVASNLSVGVAFSEGPVVVKGGHNVMPSENQNFKTSELTTAIRALTR